MSRLIFARLAQLLLLSAGLLSMRTYMSAQAPPACDGEWCNAQGTTVCCTAGNQCCRTNGGWCDPTCQL